MKFSISIPFTLVSLIILSWSCLAADGAVSFERYDEGIIRTKYITELTELTGRRQAAKSMEMGRLDALSKNGDAAATQKYGQVQEEYEKMSDNCLLGGDVPEQNMLIAVDAKFDQNCGLQEISLYCRGIGKPTYYPSHADFASMKNEDSVYNIAEGEELGAEMAAIKGERLPASATVDARKRMMRSAVALNNHLIRLNKANQLCGSALKQAHSNTCKNTFADLLADYESGGKQHVIEHCTPTGVQQLGDEFIRYMSNDGNGPQMIIREAKSQYVNGRRQGIEILNQIKKINDWLVESGNTTTTPPSS